MSADDDIPTLTDLIEKGGADDEIRLADLGLDDAGPGFDSPAPGFDDGDLEIEAFPSAGISDPFVANPALEHTVRRILDEHMELAWQEIKLAIQLELKKR